MEVSRKKVSFNHYYNLIASVIVKKPRKAQGQTIDSAITTINMPLKKIKVESGFANFQDVTVPHDICCIFV